MLKILVPASYGIEKCSVSILEVSCAKKPQMWSCILLLVQLLLTHTSMFMFFSKTFIAVICITWSDKYHDMAWIGDKMQSIQQLMLFIKRLY